MDYRTIDYGVANGVATIRLNRPDRMNTINVTMYDELIAALRAAEADGEVRCVRLAAAGDRAFSAGADLAAGKDERPADPARVAERDIHPEWTLNGVFLAREKPMVSAVNGVAAGGGLALAIMADICMASEAARFGTAHLRLAMPLLDMLGFLLPRRIGPARTADLAFTGRIVGAAEAYTIGLIDRVVPAEQLEAESVALAEQVAKQPPLGVKLTRQAIRRALGEDADDYFPFERYAFQICLRSEDAKEAMRARRDQREPRFVGR